MSTRTDVAQAAETQSARKESLKRGWYIFSRDPLSVFGLVLVLIIIIAAVFADQLAPFPQDAGMVTHMMNTFQPPGAEHLAGTDQYGRDVLSRALIGLRPSLIIAVIVLLLSLPLGIILGLVAGYLKDSFISSLIMRCTDIFMSVPPLILAMVVCTMFTNNYLSCALGIGIAWWPWYTRLVYNMVVSLSNELFIVYTELSGVKVFRILLSEMLPNITGSIFTKMTLDVGSIIIIASSMSFVGLGVQPPTPSLGSMIAEGVSYLPEFWWITVAPSLIVVLVVMGFNLLGDGLNDILAGEIKK